MDLTTKKLTDFTTGVQFSDLPAAALKAAKARIVSTLAVSLAAFDFEPIRIVKKIAQPVAGGPADSMAASSPLEAALPQCVHFTIDPVLAASPEQRDAAMPMAFTSCGGLRFRR